MAANKNVPGSPARTTQNNLQFKPSEGLQDIQALVTFSFTGPSGVFVLYRGERFQVDSATASTMIAQGLAQ